jgi:tetratricopeptide (TPR) repeat protein
LEWSLDLLGDVERRLFARLASFAGSGTTDAVAEVCGVPPLDGRDLSALLRRLIRASLVVAHPDLPGRWTMLESIRELAVLELAAVGEADELAARHRAWFARRVEDVEDSVGLTGQAQVMDDLTADHDNVRRAVDTALTAGDAAVALRITAAMVPYWTSHGDWTEGCERLAAALAMPSMDLRLRGRALVAIGNLELMRVDLASADTHFTEAGAAAAAVGDQVTLAKAHAGGGFVAFRRSRLADAQGRWEEALATAERAGDERLVASVLRSLAIAEGTAGHQTRAGELLDHAIASARSVGDDQLLRQLLGSSAEMHLWLGHYQLAEDTYGEALAVATSISDLSARPLLLAELGWVALLRGDVVSAERLSIDAAELAEDMGAPRVLAHALRLKGEALVRRRDALGADDALDRALETAEAFGAPAEIAGVLCSQAGAALERRDLDEARRLAEAALALSALRHSMRRTSLDWVLGLTALIDGDVTTAERHFRTDLEQAEHSQLRRHEANSTWGLAQVATVRGMTRDAVALHGRALGQRREMGDRLGVVDSLVGVAGAVAPMEPVGAARLVGAATALRVAVGATATLRETAEMTAVLAAVTDAAGVDAAEAGRRGGAEMDEDAAVELAAQVGARPDDE